MGINKPNVRFVVHPIFHVRSLSGDWAAGEMVCQLFLDVYDPADMGWLRRMLDEKDEGPQQVESHKLNAMMLSLKHKFVGAKSYSIILVNTVISPAATVIFALTRPNILMRRTKHVRQYLAFIESTRALGLVMWLKCCAACKRAALESMVMTSSQLMVLP